jgi:hypothetical protein
MKRKKVLFTLTPGSACSCDIDGDEVVDVEVTSRAVTRDASVCYIVML